MNKMLMYDQYDETYREVIDVKELKRYIEEKIEELEKQDRESRMSHNYLVIPVLQSFLKDLEVEEE